uniref:Uncharacterized protein n=1 Tax=Ralstonia solanacearum TaxID=305 RepID=A0A0S4UFJ5_RALSL|nr:protein of unknown function [Ralstonia solanacearum]CUV31259.1 protein of unknown function [Ralstonia solanacearum]
MAGAALLVRLDMTVGMQNRVAGKCGSAAMAAGDVFGCERAACLWRGEARILGGANGAQCGRGKKKPAILRASNSAISIAPEGQWQYYCSPRQTKSG